MRREIIGRLQHMTDNWATMCEEFQQQPVARYLVLLAHPLGNDLADAGRKPQHVSRRPHRALAARVL